MPLVKKNRQNTERRKRSGYTKKLSSDWLEKDQWENVICVHSISCTWIIFVGRGRVKSFNKSDFKSRWMEGERKSFTKNCFFIVFFFSIIKNIFYYVFTKFSYVIQTHAISSPWSQILQRTGMSSLCNIGTRSKPRDVSWLFWVYPTKQYSTKFFRS